ncbi:hypothetical protein Hypma_001064 [Hypsizygus marmoreus]|uniref:Fungal-type protein kinase domain-containing protein n=1 Tax=Hypsizygus marmoreus TaxID=39966 RepID=A0A369J6C5_HYPMA|nr:hypothetical protein Hypma_001064 [Hypsizygus marmoreus]
MTSSWPPYILEQFDTIAPQVGQHDATEYYGPYNGLLAELFPSSEHFMIVPPHKHPGHPHAGVDDFPTSFIVRRDEHPVFFVEIKPSSHLDTITTRNAADREMRERFEALSTRVKIPTLYGISAIGTNICVYAYQTESGEIAPRVIEKDARTVEDGVPVTRWRLDITTAEGEQRIWEIVNEVKVMCSRQL